MANKISSNISINSILNGFSATQYLGVEGSYNSAVGIDPDFAVGSDIRTSGLIVPVAYEKFSGTEFTGFPNWIITNNKTTNTFIYTSDGKLHSFDSALAMRATDEKTTALPISITGGAGNGAAFYNNFIYLAEATDVTQYGGMDQGASITITENVWTGGKFSKSALTNTTYPTVRGVAIPNHPMHVHGDNSLYFGDVVNGQGVLHRIHTKKVTIEGDTDDTTVPSAFNALDLPSGYYPTDIESYGTDVVISAIYSNGSTINQGNGALFFWDPTNTDTFYRQVTLIDPLVTAMKNINGTLYIWSGNASNGVRLSKYVGGETVQEVEYLEEGTPPFAGAVDAIGVRPVWGSWQTYPISSASVFAYGSKKETLPKGLHNIAKSTSSGTTPTITSLKVVQQADNIKPRLIIGFGDGSAKGLDKLSSTATYTSVFRTKMMNVGSQFDIDRIRIPLASAVNANTSIGVKIYFDDGSDSATLTTINNTNFPGARKIVYKNPELSQAGASGENNFFLEFTWNGTSGTPISLPIKIKVGIWEDEQWQKTN